MKHISLLRTAMIAAGCGAALSVSTGASATCNGGASLQGYYGVVVSGSSIQGGYGKYLVGTLFFSGDCTLSAIHVNGGINGSFTSSTAFGNYYTRGNQTIALTLNVTGQSSPQTYSLALAPSTGEAFGIETDNTSVATIALTPQNRQPPSYTPLYTTSSLNGTYSLSCIGNSASFSDVNRVTFDGKGNMIGLDVYNNEGDQATTSFSGTYKVYGDGTFTVILKGFFADYTIYGVLAEGTETMGYLYSINGKGGIETCTGKD